MGLDRLELTQVSKCDPRPQVAPHIVKKQYICVVEKEILVTFLQGGSRSQNGSPSVFVSSRKLLQIPRGSQQFLVNSTLGYTGAFDNWRSENPASTKKIVFKLPLYLPVLFSNLPDL